MTLTNTTDSVTVVSSVSYGVAGEMTSFVSGGGTEGRSYNVNGQMTTLTLPGRTITYNFPGAGSNNGKVSSVVDSGETISYAYDALQRLISATGSGWSQTYSYDGFGNMTGKVGTGGAPSWSNGIDPATNRLSGVSFDANGNQLALPMTSGMPDVFTATYDSSNRMTYVENPTQSRRTWYEYDAGNKRIYEKRVDGSTQEWFHYFGITGQRLARYSFTVSGAVITFAEHENSVWFGGKLVRNAGSWTNEDRLGSVGKYLPYGEDKPGATNPANDSVKFATYTRDAGTGIDYADQRWHAQGVGRFLTSDPDQASAGPGDPGSWNRYGYVGGDPIKFNDRKGLVRDCDPEMFKDPTVHAMFCPEAPAPSGKSCKIDGTTVPCGLFRVGDAILTESQFQTWWYSVSRVQTDLVVNLPPGANPTDPATARAYLVAMGLDQYIDVDRITFANGSFTAPLLNGVSVQQFQSAVANNGYFGNGIFGLLHIGGPDGVGFPASDYRSFTSANAPLSMQINFGPDGWRFDFDRYNPYQDLFSIWLHMACEVGHLCP